MSHAGKGADQLEQELPKCWDALLTAVQSQDKPDHSLAAALRQKGALKQDLLEALAIGLVHGFAGVRDACFAFWHDTGVQCVLGQHLQGAIALSIDTSIHCQDACNVCWGYIQAESTAHLDSVVCTGLMTDRKCKSVVQVCD